MSWIIVLILLAQLSLVRECEGQLPQPQTSSCTTDDWSSYLATLPNVDRCRPSVIAVLQFVTTGSDDHGLPNVLENVCNLECDWAFAIYLTSTSNYSFTAEFLEHYCTFINGTSTLGAYCRLTALDVFNKSLLRDLFLCHPITPGSFVHTCVQTGTYWGEISTGSLYNSSAISTKQ